ncbi:MAG: response regulator [Verrucomicrobia bacterium]|nr:response regulator [Verrucomicrobiota bacterium]
MSDETIRVLLVEDDEDDYLITQSLLARATGLRFNLVWCDRLEKGIRHLTDNVIDIVILDFSLPDSAGWSTFSRIRETAPHVPIVFLTGLTDEHFGVEAVKHGAQDYLLKGATDTGQLVRAIRYAIERKRWEEDLRRYQERLQDLVDDATQELLTANEQLRREVTERRAIEGQLREAVHHLEEHNQAKSQFVSNVSHELRTPLASISHAIENLGAGVLGPLDDRVRTYVEMMAEDCQRLKSTVTDILDLTRMEANRFELNRRKLHFGRLVEQAVASLRSHLDEKNHCLELKLDGQSAFIDCDPLKMTRVIVNLVGNAIKYTPDGGLIRVILHPDAEQPGWDVLNVIDNGIGIAPHHIDRVTERFFRVGEQVSGTGLGLALSKDLVDMHGGHLKMFSPPPGETYGTQVSVYLPVADPLRVVVVDDDPVIREILEHSLRRYGCTPICLGTAQEGLDALRADPSPDMLITDIVLPDMDGFELIAHVKGDAHLRGLPILAITGHLLDGERQEFLDGFGIGCLMKPWGYADFIRHLELVTIGASLDSASTVEGLT